MQSDEITKIVIEKITRATELAFEKLKEVEKDSKAKTKRIRSLQINLDTSQNNVYTLQNQLEDKEDKFSELVEENKKLKETLLELEIETTRKECVLKDKLVDEKNTVETLKSEIKLKNELCNKQKEEIASLNVENLKYKKITKKYAKSINTVSPQTVNNIQFVKKFPIMETKYNNLIQKLQETEKERDNLLSRIITGSKRPAPVQPSSSMDKNARIMQQFSPAVRAAARQQQQQQFIPRHQYSYVYNNSNSSNTSPSTAPDAKKQKL